MRNSYCSSFFCNNTIFIATANGCDRTSHVDPIEKEIPNGQGKCLIEEIPEMELQITSKNLSFIVMKLSSKALKARGRDGIISHLNDPGMK